MIVATCFALLSVWFIFNSAMKRDTHLHQLPHTPRILVVGTTGAGKTTLARSLSERLNIPHIEVDGIRHGPNWTETPDDLFRERVSAAIEGKPAWVIDGNYSVLRDITWARATTIIWLDYSFPVVFSQLFRRTISRSVHQTVLWNGNRESLWKHFFTRDSLLLWAFKTHWRRRRQLPRELTLPQHAHLQVIRFPYPSQTRRWLRTVTASKNVV